MLLLLKLLQAETKTLEGILRSPVHTKSNAPEFFEWGIFEKRNLIAAMNRNRRRLPQTAVRKLTLLQFRISVHLQVTDCVDLVLERAAGHIIGIGTCEAVVCRYNVAARVEQCLYIYIYIYIIFSNFSAKFQTGLI